MPLSWTDTTIPSEFFSTNILISLPSGVNFIAFIRRFLRIIFNIFGSANIEFQPEGPGNSVLAYTNFSYQGIELNSDLDLTSMEYLHLDVWTVTTDRVINREQNGLFNRVVSEMDLYRIQDVTAEQKGFFPTILHYGNVYIQSAGVKERFIFEQVPSPYRVAKIIQKLDERAKQEHHVD